MQTARKALIGQISWSEKLEHHRGGDSMRLVGAVLERPAVNPGVVPFACTDLVVQSKLVASSIDCGTIVYSVTPRDLVPRRIVDAIETGQACQTSQIQSSSPRPRQVYHQLMMRHVRHGRRQRHFAYDRVM